VTIVSETSFRIMLLHVLNIVRFKLQNQVFSNSVRTSFLSTTSSAQSQFNFDKPNASRRPPKRRAERTMRDPRTLAWMGLALLATVAAPKIINDVIDMFDDGEEEGKE